MTTPSRTGIPWSRYIKQWQGRPEIGLEYSQEEAISVMDAIKVYTWNGAYLGKEEQNKGSIEPGKLADIIVLDKDILETPTEEVPDIKVLLTVVGGKNVYERHPL